MCGPRSSVMRSKSDPRQRAVVETRPAGPNQEAHSARRRRKGIRGPLVLGRTVRGSRWADGVRRRKCTGGGFPSRAAHEWLDIATVDGGMGAAEREPKRLGGDNRTRPGREGTLQCSR